jgi:hypothetical protein
MPVFVASTKQAMALVAIDKHLIAIAPVTEHDHLLRHDHSFAGDGSCQAVSLLVI